MLTPADTVGPPDVRVLLVDDHQMFAESTGRILAAEPGIVVVGIAASMVEAVELARRNVPDVAVVDYQLPDGDGVETARRIAALELGVRVLILTGSQDRQLLVDAIDAGCCGFVTKDRALHELVQAVRSAHAGEAYLTPGLLTSLLPRFGQRHRGVGSDLTSREREVLALMAEGRTNPAIAALLVLSIHTIRNHVQNILVKLSAHTKLEAVAIASREGLLQPRR